MALATLTKTGRAAIALAISSRPLHLAWGSGDPAWDADGATLPSLIGSTALINELVANPDRNIAAALAAKKVQRFLLDNAQVTTVTDAPEKE